VSRMLTLSGVPARDEDVMRLWPLESAQFAMLGHYMLSVPGAIAQGAFRPLLALGNVRTTNCERRRTRSGGAHAIVIGFLNVTFCTTVVETRSTPARRRYRFQGPVSGCGSSAVIRHPDVH
jgi:hypothetical protein